MRLEGKTVSLTVVTRETSQLFWKQQDEKISEIFLVNKLVVIEEKQQIVTKLIFVTAWLYSNIKSVSYKNNVRASKT